MIKWVNQLKSLDDDMIKVDGVTLYKVEIVGTLIKVKNDNTKNTLTIRDTDSQIDVIFNKRYNEDKSGILKDIDLSLKTKLLIRVIFDISTYGGKVLHLGAVA